MSTPVRERVDSFARMVAPSILRLAFRDDGADLLANLTPLDTPGRRWGSIVLPLERQIALLQRDRTDLVEIARGRGEQELASTAVDEGAFVSAHLTNIDAEADLIARSVRGGVGATIARTARLAAVVAALSAAATGVSGQNSIWAINAELAPFTRSTARQAGTGSGNPIENLVSAYLAAKEVSA